MKIAILNATGGGMSGGYKKYLLNIIPRLSADSHIESLLCISPKLLDVHAWFKPMQNVKFANCESYNFFGYRFDRALQKKIDLFSPDLIFIPVERPINYRSIPIVTMIQNMEPFANGIDRYTVAEKVRCWLQSVTGKMAVKNATRVIAISEFVRDFLKNTWHTPDNKIRVVYYGLPDNGTSIYTKPEKVPFNWSGKFLFTAGSIRPARGLEDLILAAKKIDFSSLDICGVVIAGKTTPDMLRYKHKLLRLIKENGLESRILFLEEIDPYRMAWCYAHCALFLITSRVEACPNIVLEAMFYGCVCISTKNPPMPEFFRDCAVYYTPGDAGGLAGAINATLKLESGKKDEMSRKAQAFAAEFSWDNTVNGLISEFSKAVETRRRGQRKTF